MPKSTPFQIPSHAQSGARPAGCNISQPPLAVSNPPAIADEVTSAQE